MTVNHLVLSGRILRQKQYSSPSGIKHVLFTLEHKSEQLELGMPRQVYCQVQVVLSGERLNVNTDNLKVGVELQVAGYLSMQRNKNGQSRLLLHAEDIELKF